MDTIDLVDYVTPDESFPISYRAGNGLTSTVLVQTFHLDSQIIVVGTELEDNPGASITNSIEEFAKAISQIYPGKTLHFIECYRWPGEPPTFDNVTFKTEDFKRPAWRRMDKEYLQFVISEINGHRNRSLNHE